MVSDDVLADLCDENGFLIQAEEWSDDIAEAFAAQAVSYTHLRAHET